MNEYDHLPMPKEFLENNDRVAMYHIVPVTFLHYKEGYNRLVQDVYTAAYSVRSLKWLWVRNRRVVSHSRPLHLDIYGNEQPCEECDRYPNRPDDIIIAGEGYDTTTAISTEEA